MRSSTLHCSLAKSFSDLNSLKPMAISAPTASCTACESVTRVDVLAKCNSLMRIPQFESHDNHLLDEPRPSLHRAGHVGSRKCRVDGVINLIYRNAESVVTIELDVRSSCIGVP
jgi:hypothetical protein